MKLPFLDRIIHKTVGIFRKEHKHHTTASPEIVQTSSGTSKVSKARSLILGQNPKVRYISASRMLRGLPGPIPETWKRWR